MRKITVEACGCLIHLISKTIGNTYVKVPLDTNGAIVKSEMYLHGNRIATYYKRSNTLEITNCGWTSNVTKERLNGLPGVSITQKCGVWYLNGEVWDGSLKTIRLDRNVGN